MKFQLHYCSSKICVWNNSLFRCNEMLNWYLIPSVYLKYHAQWFHQILENEKLFPPIFMQVECRRKGKIGIWTCHRGASKLCPKACCFYWWTLWKHDHILMFRDSWGKGQQVLGQINLEAAYSAWHFYKASLKLNAAFKL